MKENIFTKIMVKKPKKSKFDLSHDLKTSFKMGQLIPTTVMDVVPNESYEISVENMLRFTPLTAPIMHKVDVTTHYFFVPNRILWDGWEDFITGENTTDAAPTFLGVDTINAGSLGDYFGLPTDATASAGTTVNALPFAAYAKIWDECYRDQNLQTTEAFTPLTNGNNAWVGTLAAADPLRRAWQHDYFTACLPWAQKGDAVTLPLTNTATIPVETVSGLSTPGLLRDPNNDNLVSGTATGVVSGETSVSGGTSTRSYYDPDGTLAVDINAEAVAINDLRTAFSVQRWLEKNARAGTRYIESLKAHFGGAPTDARLQRPEYIGGSKQNMIISEVLATAQTQNSSNPAVPVGQMSGHGISVGGGNRFKYHVKEHGWIIGLINVQPRTAYQQGLHKMFSRPTYQDYLWPEFANIGEQAVLNQEVFLGGTGSATRQNTFGYIPRYAEYRYMNSRVSGLMRTDLAFWHLGRIFTSPPDLNADFVECEPSDRIFTTIGQSGDDQIIAHIFNNIHAVRPLPKYAIPSGLV